jgi:hypothetical protein
MLQTLDLKNKNLNLAQLLVSEKKSGCDKRRKKDRRKWNDEQLKRE